MPKCKNCGTRLTKFDKDICPVCGVKDPLEGVSSETIEITSQLNIDKEEFKTYHPTKKIVAFLLFFLLGWTGIGFLYVKEKKAALIWALCCIAFGVGLALILIMSAKLDIVTGIVIPISIVYGFNIVVSLFYLLKRDLKDGNGEFLK